VQLNTTHHWIRFGMIMPPAIVLVQNQASPKPLFDVMFHVMAPAAS
jgi:hypothetical protein